MQNNDTIPQFVADGVAIEADVFEQNYYSKYSTFKQIVPEVYKKAVQPYAEKVYVLEQLIKQQQQELADTKDALASTVKLLSVALKTINNIIDKIV